MNEKTKSLIRHALTAVGFVLGLVGLNKYTGIVDLLTGSLDAVWAAITTVVGLVVSIIGFFRNKERFTKTVGVVLLLFCAGFLHARSSAEHQKFGSGHEYSWTDFDLDISPAYCLAPVVPGSSEMLPPALAPVNLQEPEIAFHKSGFTIYYTLALCDTFPAMLPLPDL